MERGHPPQDPGVELAGLLSLLGPAVVGGHVGAAGGGGHGGALGGAEGKELLQGGGQGGRVGFGGEGGASREGLGQVARCAEQAGQPVGSY